MTRQEKTQQSVSGWFIMGKYTSVAWFLNRKAAENEAERMNYRGGQHYIVVASNNEVKNG